jgi:hypothetical protein
MGSNSNSDSGTKRRWFQPRFNLRTLFFWVAVAAVAIAIAFQFPVRSNRMTLVTKRPDGGLENEHFVVQERRPTVAEALIRLGVGAAMASSVYVTMRLAKRWRGTESPKVM